MAFPTVTNLHSSGDPGNKTVYTTGSFTTPAGHHIAVWVVALGGNQNDAPSLSGHGISWTRLSSFVDSGIRYAFYCFTGTGLGNSGTLTITWPSTVISCTWHVAGISGGAGLLRHLIESDGVNVTSVTVNDPGVGASSVFVAVASQDIGGTNGFWSSHANSGTNLLVTQTVENSETGLYYSNGPPADGTQYVYPYFATAPTLYALCLEFSGVNPDPVYRPLQIPRKSYPTARTMI